MTRDLGTTQVNVSADLAALARPTAEWLDGEITRAIAERDRCSLCLAGGRTPEPVYRQLASGRGIDWSKVDVYFGDERGVPPDHPDSNYRMVCATLLTRVPSLAGRIHRMEAERPDRDAAARDYERLLPPRLDVLVLGMGADGHTASLFPGSAALDERRRRVVAVLGNKLPAERLTITPPVIEEARVVAVIATGEDKAPAVARAIEGPLDAERRPGAARAAGDVVSRSRGRGAAHQPECHVVITPRGRYRRHQRAARHRGDGWPRASFVQQKTVSQPRTTRGSRRSSAASPRLRAPGPSGPVSAIACPGRRRGLHRAQPSLDRQRPDAGRRDRDPAHRHHQRLRRGGLCGSSCWDRSISVTLQEGSPTPQGPIALIGAGTGLGQGFLVWEDDHYLVLPSEGGHSDFAPTRHAAESGCSSPSRHSSAGSPGSGCCRARASRTSIEYLPASGVAPEQPAVRAEIDAEDAGARDRPACARQVRLPFRSGARPSARSSARRRATWRSRWWRPAGCISPAGSRPGWSSG